MSAEPPQKAAFPVFSAPAQMTFAGKTVPKKNEQKQASSGPFFAPPTTATFAGKVVPAQKKAPPVPVLSGGPFFAAPSTTSFAGKSVPDLQQADKSRAPTKKEQVKSMIKLANQSILDKVKRK